MPVLVSRAERAEAACQTLQTQLADAAKLQHQAQEALAMAQRETASAVEQVGSRLDASMHARMTT